MELCLMTNGLIYRLAQSPRVTVCGLNVVKNTNGGLEPRMASKA